MVKKSRWTPGILLKMEIVNVTHFTLANLEILTVKEVIFIMTLLL